jgi:hypothetical protein
MTKPPLPSDLARPRAPRAPSGSVLCNSPMGGNSCRGTLDWRQAASPRNGRRARAASARHRRAGHWQIIRDEAPRREAARIRHRAKRGSRGDLHASCSRGSPPRATKAGVPGCEELEGQTLRSLAMRILSRKHVLDAVGRVPRPLNIFETKAMICDLAGENGGRRKSRR